jgi:hypothetical protein
MSYGNKSSFTYLFILCLGGADRTTQEVTRLLGSLPPAVQALTGVDLTGVSFPLFL